MMPITTTSSVLPLVLSMGDPAGIGPEIIVRALMERPELRRVIVVAGDMSCMKRAVLAVPGGAPRPVLVKETSDLVALEPDCFAVLQACEPVPNLKLGQISATAGRAAASCVRLAAQAVLEGQASALVTAPVHKEALALAGVAYPGHTEFLQALAARHLGLEVAQVPVRMMLSCPGLRTVLVSIHVSLSDALRAVTIDQVLSTLRIAAAFFSSIGMPEARIAVAGLNPHAGEGGLFGREELEVIAPAIALARQEGVVASGPHAPDTVFMRARQGEFDVVIAMYHDQGLIPVKLLGLEHGVNTTLGLPFVRTSPDHGTAFDLVGTGRASASSLLAAIGAAQRP
jgi:4-hydroxythreonine-4-phosphate dehydrogenase